MPSFSNEFTAVTAGHERCTRNIATTASYADKTLLLLDAKVGVEAQNRAHFEIARMLGIKQFVVAFNKTDFAGHKRKVFENVCNSLGSLTTNHQIAHPVAPVSGLIGNNVPMLFMKML